MNNHYIRSLSALLLAAAFPGAADAQSWYALQHSIPAPPVGLQRNTNLGAAVAADGAYIVVGAPMDDLLAGNAGLVKVFDSSTGALAHVIPHPSPGDFSMFGAAVAISGSRVVVGTPSTVSAYVFDLSSPTPTIPVVVLRNQSDMEDSFGNAVAISGSRVIVSASFEENPSLGGSAFIFDLDSATPALPIITLLNPGSAPLQHFGASVGISGTRAVVGAPVPDKVYVYDLSNATPTVPVTTLNSPTGEDAQFGTAVAISGARILVGDSVFGNTGRAYVYDLTTAAPATPVVTLNNPAPAPGDFFGNSVAISGTQFVIGAPRDDAGAVDTGTAYFYDLSSAFPAVPVATLNNPTPAAGDSFGSSVALSGTRLVVGAPEDDTRSQNGGSAYVYGLSGPNIPAPVAVLNSPSPTSNDRFGSGLALSGALLAVGADGGGLTEQGDLGHAYVFDLSSATPASPIAAFSHPGTGGRAEFGASIGISGRRVIVGARYDSTGGRFSAGSAYIYDLDSPSPTVPVVTLNNPTPADSDFFGTSVAISGARVVVSSPMDDTGAGDAGSAYVYNLNSPTPAVPVVTLNNPRPTDGNQFGWTVAISGSRIVVGAIGVGGDFGNPGAAYVFDLNSGTPSVPVATLPKPDSINGGFGYSVAISGTRVVVGAPGQSAVYDLNSPTPLVPVATLKIPTPGSNDDFTALTGISGTRVVIGASGGAYVYDLSSAAPAVHVARLNTPQSYVGSAAIDGPIIALGRPYAASPQAFKGAASVFTSDLDRDGLLDAWEIARFGTTAGHSALDDSDRDGRVELLELAFDTDPTRSEATAVPVVVNEDGYLTLTLTKRAGVAYLGQSAATPDPAAFSTATTGVLINNATTLKVRDIVAVGSAPRRFMRVQVSAAP